MVSIIMKKHSRLNLKGHNFSHIHICKVHLTNLMIWWLLHNPRLLNLKISNNAWFYISMLLIVLFLLDVMQLRTKKIWKAKLHARMKHFFTNGVLCQRPKLKLSLYLSLSLVVNGARKVEHWLVVNATSVQTWQCWLLLKQDKVCWSNVIKVKVIIETAVTTHVKKIQSP